MYNGQLVFAVTMLNKLVFADVRKKKVLGEVMLASPGRRFSTARDGFTSSPKAR